MHCFMSVIVCLLCFIAVISLTQLIGNKLTILKGKKQKGKKKKQKKAKQRKKEPCSLPSLAQLEGKKRKEETEKKMKIKEEEGKRNGSLTALPSLRERVRDPRSVG